MPAFVALLLLALWLPAQAGPCTSPFIPTCRPMELRNIVVGKTILDPLVVSAQVISQPFDNGFGTLGQLDSAVVDGLVMYRVSVDPASQGAVAAFTLTGPGLLQPDFALLDNAAGDGAPDWALQDTLAPQDISFAFANGLAPGQASRWIVNTQPGTTFAALALGSTVDMAGIGSAGKPLLAAVPEPASALLVLGGLLALRSRLRRA